MFNFLSNNCDNKKLINIIFYTASIVFALLSFMRIFNSTGYILDTYEHIHASWLISEGLIPYKDFFEHHNPLLWYLLSPITKIFYRDANIIYVIRVIAVLGYLLTLYLLYNVSFKYCKNDISAKLSVIFMLCFACFWKDVQNIRPDIFMYISMLIALLYTFKYLDSQRTSFLSYSYTAWFVSFLFLQKSFIYGLGFIIANLFLIKKNKIKLKDILVASIFPLILLSLLLFIAYKYDVLKNWYIFNFDFNIIMKKNFGSYHSGITPWKMNLCFYSLSFIVIRYFKYTDKGIVVLFMWLAGFLQMFYFAPHPQYYFFNFLLISILFTPILKKLHKNRLVEICICCVIFLSFSFFILYNTSKNSASIKNEIKLIKYVIDNTNHQDVLPNSNLNYNLFNPNMHFHWLGLYTITMLADLYLEDGFDYNTEIKKHKPKLLFIDDYSMDRILHSNSYYIRVRNDALLKKASQGELSYLDKRSYLNFDYWNIDMDFVKDNYEYIENIGNTQIWKRIGN